MANTVIRFVFFDLGGVVFNFKDGFEKLSKIVGRSRPSVETAYLKHVDLAALGKISTTEFWVRFREELQLSSDEGIVDYAEFWTDSFSPISETHALIQELATRYRLGILSNTELGVLEKALSKGHVPVTPFAAVVRSCDVGFLKPEKEIYLLAQERINVQPGEILFVDDREVNVLAAISLGWRGVVFDESNPGKSVREIKETLI